MEKWTDDQVFQFTKHRKMEPEYEKVLFWTEYDGNYYLVGPDALLIALSDKAQELDIDILNPGCNMGDERLLLDFGEVENIKLILPFMKRGIETASCQLMDKDFEGVSE
jgi:hypothetical protein